MMTVRLRLVLISGALISAYLAVYGAKVLLSGLFDPILRAVGA